MRSVHLLFLSLAATALCPAFATAAPPLPPRPDLVVPHRAVYEITLARTDQGSGVSTASGRMVFEITGGACLGYTMRQRMVVNIGDEEGKQGRLDFRISTFESGAGDLYSFDSRTSVNAEVVEAVEGEARRAGPKIEVKLTHPTERTIALDGDTLFPGQHLQAILQAAIAERDFVAAEIYEGAGTGDASDAASASIGKAVESGGGGPLRGGVRRWPVSVGYFDRGEAKPDDLGEELPSYQMQFTLYENGVTNDLLMDYGDYALSGSLESIEPLTTEECPSR